jgi:hypothetical protein
MTQEYLQRLTRALSALCAQYPNWRFGQSVANIAGWARGPVDGAVWDVEDDEFLLALEAHLARREAERGINAVDAEPASRAS